MIGSKRNLMYTSAPYRRAASVRMRERLVSTGRRAALAILRNTRLSVLLNDCEPCMRRPSIDGLDLSEVASRPERVSISGT
ncbi:hypothetical protein D3C84_1134090 [compost metagenome]